MDDTTHEMHWTNTMRVELVATKESESLVLGKLPTMIRDDAEAKNHFDDPIKGNYHCLISRVDEQLVLWDLGSGGGTFVNGVQVTKAALHVGDRVRLGDTEFAVRCEENHPRRYLYGPRT
jgi:pSer/pThr/pTyr-binding forkhead associated (FHA) protein